MMVRIFSICMLISFLSAPGVYAEEVKLPYEGLTLNARLNKAETWPAGPTVLIIHGTLLHNQSELISFLQELFLDHGVNSLAINLSLGLNDRHGPYDCSTPHNHTHEDAVNEIGAWLDWLKQQKVEQVVLLGHSRGGNQAAWFAAEHDDPVLGKVILVAPQTWDADTEASNYEEGYGKPLAPVLEKSASLVAAGHPETLMEHTDFIYCADAVVSAKSMLSYYAVDPRKDTPWLLPKINKPVLVFAGSEDQVYKGLDVTLAPLAESGAIEVEVLDGADHFFRDLYAEDLVERSVEFINE